MSAAETADLLCLVSVSQRRYAACGVRGAEELRLPHVSISRLHEQLQHSSSVRLENQSRHGGSQHLDSQSRHASIRDLSSGPVNGAHATREEGGVTPWALQTWSFQMKHTLKTFFLHMGIKRASCNRPASPDTTLDADTAGTLGKLAYRRHFSINRVTLRAFDILSLFNTVSKHLLLYVQT